MPRFSYKQTPFGIDLRRHNEVTTPAGIVFEGFGYTFATLGFGDDTNKFERQIELIEALQYPHRLFATKEIAISQLIADYARED